MYQAPFDASNVEAILSGPRSHRTHAVIPDVQCKDGVPLEHLGWAGNYLAAKKPDVIVCIGDFADMESLSSYDAGKKCFEGRRYSRDIEVTHLAMSLLMDPINKEREKSGWNPRLVMTLGNHEDRITRAVESDPKLDGTMGLDDLKYKEFGWEVYPYLQPVEIDGVSYCHFYTSGVMGRPASSAAVVLRERMGSAIQGHVQKVDIAIHPKTGHIAMMVGTFYQHSESYLGFQGNNCRKQLVMLHEVRDGRFDPMMVSLDFLRRRYS